MRSSKKNRFLCAVVCLVLIFSLVGCKNGGDVQPPAEPVKENAQGVTDTTIKIGSVGVTSGPYAVIGKPYYEGMNAYFNKVNDAGGVNGRKIELIVKDDEFKPDKSLAAVESLINDEKVFAIVGHLGTPGVMASLETVKEAGIPSVYFGGGAVQFTTAGPNFFPVQPNYIFEGSLMVRFAKEVFNAKKIAVLHSNDDIGKDGLAGVQEGLKIFGMESALTKDGIISYAATDTDYTVVVQKTKAYDPDLIIIYSLMPVNILKEMDKVGYNCPILTTYSNAEPSFIALAGQAAPTATANMNALGWLSADLEQMQPYFEMQEKYFPGSAINAYTMAGWVAAETFVAGLEIAGDNLSWEGFIKAMEECKFDKGLAPSIDYSNGRRLGVTTMAMSSAAKLEDGTYTYLPATDFIGLD